jgi:molybdate transport system substrate-binding protein
LRQTLACAEPSDASEETGMTTMAESIGAVRFGVMCRGKLRGAALGLALAGGLTALPAAAQEAGPKPCDISVMISGAFNASYQVIAPAFEAARGKTLCTAQGPSMGATPQAIPNRLARGEPADIVILARASLDDLVARGVVRRDSAVDLIRSKIAMAVKKGAPKPDISTGDKFKAALLNARSIAYSDSASGVYMKTEMFKAMGIEDQIAGKHRAIPATPVGIEVAQGRAELGFQQLSELMPIPGIDIVGTIPAPWQRVTVFSAGIPANARHPEEARVLLQKLTARAAWPTIRETGVEPAAAPQGK